MAGRSIRVSAAVVATIRMDGYSRIKRLLMSGQAVKSNPFSLGGQQWFVAYYPNGRYSSSGTMSVYLFLDSADAKDEVRAQVTYSLLDKNGSAPVPSHNYANDREYTFRSGRDLYLDSITHQDLEELGHLGDDGFSISLHITVLKGTVHKGRQIDLEVPPSNLHQHLGDLLSSTDGADVTFHVGGETFLAHRSVLAARSSVFKAELLGAMKENLGDPVKIDDMEACVFKSLLNFIYTDSLMCEDEGTDEDEKRGDIVTASHLLVAADRYNIERLKLICEDKLCCHIDVDMVATSLALAEQHGCHGLKEACFDFLSSPSNLEAMKASDGYEHLKNSCPFVLKELIARFLPVELKVVKDMVMDI